MNLSVVVAVHVCWLRLCLTSLLLRLNCLYFVKEVHSKVVVRVWLISKPTSFRFVVVSSIYFWRPSFLHMIWVGTCSPRGSSPENVLFRSFLREAGFQVLSLVRSCKVLSGCLSLPLVGVGIMHSVHFGLVLQFANGFFAVFFGGVTVCRM